VAAFPVSGADRFGDEPVQAANAGATRNAQAASARSAKRELNLILHPLTKSQLPGPLMWPTELYYTKPRHGVDLLQVISTYIQGPIIGRSNGEGWLFDRRRRLEAGHRGEWRGPCSALVAIAKTVMLS